MTDPLRSDLIDAPHGFFTRRGGVSTGPYASLNCSLSRGDARDNVMENRARAAHAIGADPADLVGLMQVHGADVVHVTATWRPGEGPSADAMVTNRRGLALGVISADCAPVLFADPGAGIIGAAHAGWRGAVSGVIGAVVDAMVTLGADRSRIAAVVGPCIRQPSYEVGDDLRAAVLADAGSNERFFAIGRRNGHWQFDLAGYCAAQLATAGVGIIDVLDADTAADEDRFFSHRRNTLAGGGPLGHQISIIRLG